MSAKLPSKIVEIAIAEIGNSEVNGTNKGAEISKYFLADNYDPNGSKEGDDGYAWCAAFVCWVVREAMKSARIKETATFKRPTTAGAWAFETWSLAQDNSTQTKKPHRGDIQAGDIVVFKFSHVGIAVGKPDKNGYVMTVEGNSNKAGSRDGGSVVLQRRLVSSIRSRIRFTV
jgi:hypothetical protein